MAMDWATLLSTRRLKQSAGSSKVKGDLRDEFDRDFDRIIYCTPFRRLHDKTQVFPLEPNDSVRTRLTHSLEVSHAARGMARDVCRRLVKNEEVTGQQAKFIETIAATCGLMHDLGNPPFGHSGEVAIRDWFTRNGAEEVLLRDLSKACAYDLLHFEGNAQTLRLVTKLQILADFHGLNLTCGTLSASSKYTAGSDAMDEEVHENSKVGYFASECAIIEKIRDTTGTGPHRNPITFLVEAADDAVYNTVDLEDGLRKGILDWGFVKKSLRARARGDGVLKECIDWAEGRVKPVVRDLSRRAKEHALIQYFRVRAIGHIVTSAAKAFISNYDRIMDGDYHGELIEDSKAKPLVDACRGLNRSRVYCSAETLKLELMGRRIIWDLMDVFWEGARQGEPDKGSFATKAYDLMSDNYRRVFARATKTGELPEKYYRLQLVTDYVCGMTDTFASQLHRRLMNG